LDRSNVIAGFKQVCGEGMPEGMTTEILDYLTAAVMAGAE